VTPKHRLAGAWRPAVAFGFLVLALGTLAPPAQALRILNYNLTNYPGTNSALRNPTFRTILQPLSPDVVVVQEMTSSAGVTNFLTNVLNTLEPGQWAAAPFYDGNDTDNALFYKTAKVQLMGSWAWYPNPLTNLRYVSVYRLKPVGYTASAAEFRIYSCHLKASQGSACSPLPCETVRLNEAIGIRDSMNAMPTGTHAFLCGDFNIYSSTETGFQKFLENQVDNDGRLYDPLNAVGTWNSGTFAAIHTQCPCLNNCPTGFGFSGGGLDDRFDMFLPTVNWNTGEGYQFALSSYKPVGNDALHYNKDINATPVIPEGQTYADALVYASDHLPVRLDIMVRSKITVASSLPFGTVIVGASAAQLLNVQNSATSPADDLDYSFTADAGFTAPGGSFSLLPGVSQNHSITMQTATSGLKGGQLHVASDDPDHATSNVTLSGTVLDHATASLDSVATVLADSLDFGYHKLNEFVDGTVRVHDRGYNSLKARLSLSNATITGGNGRFSIVGGFSPVLIGSPSKPYAIHFNDTNAATDSTYSATLTFTSADEPLPGATAQPALVVTLVARVQPATDVASALPTQTLLHTPYPNPPAAHGTEVRFDLARAAAVHIAVFDVAGRRVTELAAAAYAAGVHSVRWDGRDATGRPLGAGVYFVRMSTNIGATQTVRVTMIR
jgi:endonuclease/exonuclease/phosphatase family metal-dependent hydrolase